MAVTVGSIVLKVSDIGRAAGFWSQALGYEAKSGNPAFLGSPDDQGTRLHLDEQDRTHLDLWLAPGDDLETEVRRLIALGATRAQWSYPPDADFVVLADTEGNLFCVVES